MAENKKYYYLKLKDTFFDSEEMKILESMDNGILYQNLYLKICLISLKSNGALLFKDMVAIPGGRNRGWNFATHTILSLY